MRKKHTNRYRKNFCVEKYNATQKELLSENILTKNGLRADIFSQCAIIKMTGINFIHIENYKKIISYSEEVIIVQDKYKKIIINGTSLVICYFFDGDLDIRGHICSINFEGIG